MSDMSNEAMPGYFNTVLIRVSDEKALDYVEILERVAFMGPIATEEKETISQYLIELHFVEGDVIFEEDEPSDSLFFLYDGEVSMDKFRGEQTKLRASTKKQTAYLFGAWALGPSDPRDSTLTVTSRTAKMLCIDRESFNLLLGPEGSNKNDEGTATNGQRPGKKMRKQKLEESSSPDNKVRKKIQRRDLDKIGLMGVGSFTAVELVEHKKTGSTYALKAVVKGRVVKADMQATVMNEKNILMMTDSPFIVKLYECYNCVHSIFFLLEAALGGELHATYIRKRLHGSAVHAKFYIAGISYALDHCHTLKIIYRDLKPENLLISEAGHPKLFDMNLAKVVLNGKTYTTCGTPDFFAPEMISSIGHTIAVDWWSLGILCFEMMTGHTPFEAAYPLQIYHKVMKGIEQVRFKEYKEFPPERDGGVEHFIKALCQSMPEARLPMYGRGIMNLRDHQWYSGFDWKLMKTAELRAPYEPKVKSNKDVSNFGYPSKKDLPRQIEYKDDGSGWDKGFATCAT